MTDWIAMLQAGVVDATRALEGSGAGLALKRKQLLTQTQAALSRLDALDHPVDPGNPAVDRQRALNLARERRFGEMSRLELRCAASAIGELPSEVLGALIKAAPRCARIFVLACVSLWHHVLRSPDPSSLGALIDDHDNELPEALMSLLPRNSFRKLAVENSLREHLIPVGAPDLLGRLEKAGLRLRWSLTGHVVAEWMNRRLTGRNELNSTWQMLAADGEFGASLLPMRSGRSTHPSGHTPLEVRCRVATTLLRAGLKGDRYLTKPNAEALLDRLVASELGDPRIPPESEGWRFVKRFDKEAFEAALEELVREDIEVFFDYAMRERDRRTFWLRYVKKIRRTACILSPSKYSEIMRGLSASTDARLRGAAKRAFRFGLSTGQVNAFVIFFDSIVVVEFSVDGNAAYIYDRGWFESTIGSKISDRGLSSERELKQQQHKIDRIVHGPHWQAAASARLAEHGIG